MVSVKRGREFDWKCPVCQGRRGREETLDKVLRIDGDFVMVYGIPSIVCVYCGEEIFSDEDIEWVRMMLKGDGRKTAKQVTLDAYNFADAKELTATETKV